MGATITCGKKVGILAHDDGQHSIVLFEETYEKNCYPHTPHWSPIYIGGIAGAIRRIYSDAASCADGMLQSRGGMIEPQHHVKDWMRELLHPVEVESGQAQFRRLSTTEYGDEPTVYEKALAAIATLREKGVVMPEDFVAGVAANKGFYYRLASLAPEVLEALFGYGPGNIGAWVSGIKVPVCGKPCNPPEEALSALSARPVKSVHLADFVRLQGERYTFFMAREGWAGDDRYRLAGEKYRTFCQAIRKAGEMEAVQPGTGLAAIQSAREAMESAPVLAPDTPILITLTHTLSKWCAEERKRVIERFGGEDQVVVTAKDVVDILEYRVEDAAGRYTLLLGSEDGVYLLSDAPPKAA